MSAIQATSATVTIDGLGAKFVTKNGSHKNPHANQALMRDWQNAAIAAIRQQKVPVVDPPVVITAYVHRKTNARSDAHNVTETIAACIDALVKEQVIPDDHDGIIKALVIMRGDNRKQDAITLNIEAR